MFQIADFGLAREIGIDQSKVQVSSISGTQFYLPHEYIADRQLNTKVTRGLWMNTKENIRDIDKVVFFISLGIFIFGSF